MDIDDLTHNRVNLIRARLVEGRVQEYAGREVCGADYEEPGYLTLYFTNTIFPERPFATIAYDDSIRVY